jgi:hypothetical protein
MWPPLQIVSDSPDFPSIWLLLLNIDCCFIINQNEYKFNIEMSTLNIYSGFFCEIFHPPDLYHLCKLEIF